MTFGNAWNTESIGIGRQISRALVVYAFYSFDQVLRPGRPDEALEGRRRSPFLDHPPNYATGQSIADRSKPWGSAES